MQKGQLHDSKAMFERAIDLKNKAQSTENNDINRLNDVITQMINSGAM